MVGPSQARGQVPLPVPMQQAEPHNPVAEAVWEVWEVWGWGRSRRLMTTGTCWTLALVGLRLQPSLAGTYRPRG